MSDGTLLLVIDHATGQELQRCTGPASDGSCPRVEIGDILPCSGHGLVAAGAPGGVQPYAVSGGATLCPVTLAAALAIAPDTLLTLDD
ncbi:MAG: hypothetical protein M3R48_00955 [Candidatus Dormibacteraeota bacterium]|nr:hypothetical protein [Candidatus Dormibacteraeota bacterium]